MAETVKFGPKGQKQRIPMDSGTLDAAVQAQVRERVGEIRLTRSQERLRRLQEHEDGSGELFRTIHIPGDPEPWYIMRGSFPQIAMASMLIGRSPNGVLEFKTAQALANCAAAFLFVFCAVGEGDPTPYFESLEDAYNFVASPQPKAADAAAVLFYAIVDLNPEVWPEGEELAKKMWGVLKEAIAIQRSPEDSPEHPSSTLPETTPLTPSEPPTSTA